MRTVITTASIAAAFAVAMAQGVASAQGLTDIASDIAAAINADMFSSEVFAVVSDAPEQFGETVGTGAISLDELDGVRGGAETINIFEQNQKVNGAAFGNTISAGGDLDLRTGNISFNGSALEHFAGIGNFVINSGNNNVLQGTLSVQVLTGEIPGMVVVTPPLP